MRLVILARGKGEASFFGTSIRLEKANKPSFIDVYMWTSAETLLESLWKECTLKGLGQPVLWAAHPAFCYLSHQESGILQVDLSSKVLQQSSSPPRNTTNLKVTAVSISKPWLLPHTGEQQCSYTSGWASASLVVLDRTGWSSTMNSERLLLSVLLLWIKGLPRQALLLTSLAQPFSDWQLTLHCLSPVWGVKMHHKQRPICAILCNFYIWPRPESDKADIIDKYSKQPCTLQRIPQFPPPRVLWRFGMDSTDLAASPRVSCSLPPWHKVHLKSATRKSFSCYKWCFKVQGDDKLDP